MCISLLGQDVRNKVPPTCSSFLRKFKSLFLNNTHILICVDL